MRVGINHPARCINVFSCEVEEEIPSTLVNRKKWQLICDPTGDYVINGLFSFIDIQYGLMDGTFAPGTRFKNILSGKKLELVEKARKTNHATAALRLKYVI